MAAEENKNKHKHKHNQEEEEEEEEDQWEERSLGFIQDLSKSKKGKKKKYRIRWMNKPMVIPQLILDLQHHLSREYSLRSLSHFLLEKREEDPESYYRTGYLLYNSCSTMPILLQELVAFFRMMVDKTITKRASNRLANVLTLYQCVAANKETRQKFVNSSVPNFLVPLILFEAAPIEEVYENVRAVTLSVFGILCQAREPIIIQWAVENRMVQLSCRSIETGNDLCKVIGMHIIEAILQDDWGIYHICSPVCDHLLKGLLKTWEHLVNLLAVDQEFAPRLLFHIIRCYFLLCNHERGFTTVVKNLPDPIINGSFHNITEEFPVIGSLLQQLLLAVGKIDNCLQVSLPHDSLLYNRGIV